MAFDRLSDPEAEDGGGLTDPGGLADPEEADRVATRVVSRRATWPSRNLVAMVMAANLGVKEDDSTWRVTRESMVLNLAPLSEKDPK